MRLKRVTEAYGEDREKRGVTEVVVVACNECRETLLEAGVLSDGFATDGRRLRGIACAAAEADLQTRLACVVKAGFYGNAEVGTSAWDQIAESECEARRDTV